MAIKRIANQIKVGEDDGKVLLEILSEWYNVPWGKQAITQVFWLSREQGEQLLRDLHDLFRKRK